MTQLQKQRATKGFFENDGYTFREKGKMSMGQRLQRLKSIKKEIQEIKSIGKFQEGHQMTKRQKEYIGKVYKQIQTLSATPSGDSSQLRRHNQLVKMKAS